jgi:N-acetylmuramoyl-L-alanine amidase
MSERRGVTGQLRARVVLCFVLMAFLGAWTTDVRRGPLHEDNDQPPAPQLSAPPAAAGQTPPVVQKPGRGPAAPPSTTATGPEVRAITLSGDSARTVLSLSTSASFEATIFLLANPPRVVIDARDVRFALPPQTGSTGLGLVSKFRFGALAPGQSRIVIETTGPVATGALSETRKTGAGRILELVLTPTDEAAFSQAVAQSPAAQLRRAPEPPAPAEPTAPRRGDRRVVVIDPGHGGIDNGAVGSLAAPEKDVVLKFAHILRKKLRADRRYEVLMTREIDVFIPLDERVQFARQHNCDLFVSLHTDSVPPEYAHLDVRGATVYTLPTGGADKLAKALAEKENRSDAAAGFEQPLDAEPEVANILGDLMRRETGSRTLHFAKALLGTMGKATTMTREPHRRATFRVLRAPDVPSVLIELGYLSNKHDEQLLVAADWQDKVATSIARAIELYFAQRPARAPF